jgi:hypothetical protein
MWGVARLVGLGAGGLVVLVGARANAIEFAILIVLLTAVSLQSVLIKVFGDQRLNAAGSTRAGHWLGVQAYLAENDAFKEATPGAVMLWDRYIAYATALGLAGRATRALPMGAEDDEHAWSAYGGGWREVRVSYPRFRIIWGRSPVEALLVGLFIGAIGVAVGWLAWQFHGLVDGSTPGDEASRWLNLSAYMAMAIGALVGIWGLRTIGLAFADLRSRNEVQGRLIRCRAFEAGKNVTYFVAIDDGRAARVRAWRVNAHQYHQREEGSVVKAQFTPRLGYVYKMEAASAAAEA